MINKFVFAAGLATTVGIAGLVGVTSASAEPQSSDHSGMSSIVTKLSEKFNLNKDEVQAVFDEERTAMQAEMQQRFEDKLATAVNEGDLTQQQADTIKAKRAELQATREANRDSDMTMTERREAMQTEREALETWAEENDIPADYLRFVFGGKGGHGEHGRFGPSNESDSSSAES